MDVFWYDRQLFRQDGEKRGMVIRLHARRSCNWSFRGRVELRLDHAYNRNHLRLLIKAEVIVGSAVHYSLVRVSRLGSR